MTDDQRIDPRYDPAFQRGYAGTDAPRAVSRRPRPAAPAEPAPTAPPADVATPPPDAPRQPDAPDVIDEPVTRRVVARELLGNPFLVAAAILGVALIVAGLAWAERGRSLVTTPGGAGTELDYWFLEATVVGAPLTALAGIGVLAGVLLVGAQAWLRRPR